jgi:hypothetical protein
LAIHVENNATETRAGSKVDVQNCLLGALQGIDCATDEILTAGRENLQTDIVGGKTRFFYQTACEVEIDLGGRGERHFDFLVTNFYEHLKETVFGVDIL